MIRRCQTRRIARRLIGSLTLLVVAPLLAGCGGGGDGTVVIIGPTDAPTPTRTPIAIGTPALSGVEALDAAPGVVIASVAAAVALGSDVPAASGGSGGAAVPASPAAQVSATLVAYVVRTAVPSAEEDGAGGGAAACALGGTIAATCREIGAATIIGANLNLCTLPDEASGRRIRASGMMTVTLPRRGICSSGQVPAELAFTVDTRLLQQDILDTGGSLLLTMIFSETRIVSEPLGQGCAGDDRRTRFSGSLAMHNALAQTDLQIDTGGVTLESRTSGQPCASEVRFSGSLTLFASNPLSTNFDEHVESMRLYFPDAGDASRVAIEGIVENDCVGTLSFSSLEALEQPLGAACPLAGIVRLDTDSGLELAYFRQPFGGLDYDYEADGDIDLMWGNCSGRTSCASAR